ncbi:hypothetical protein TWF694_000925 [Orbilia ellipsospora]|uniref:Uncharacterized protein n=1 Tax=Orbilia ellipsospora TaxID=2528407 RepID=A0AAV9XTG5_9PEZI
MPIEVDVAGLNWKPFASSLLPNYKCGGKRYPKALDFIPYRAPQRAKRHPKNQIESLKKVFAKRGNIYFEAVEDIRFSAPETFEDKRQKDLAVRYQAADDFVSKLVFDIIKQFPSIKKLTIPFTAGVLLESEIIVPGVLQQKRETAQDLSLRKLKYLSCDIGSSYAGLADVMLSIDFSVMKVPISSNSDTLQSL